MSGIWGKGGGGLAVSRRRGIVEEGKEGGKEGKRVTWLLRFVEAS